MELSLGLDLNPNLDIGCAKMEVWGENGKVWEWAEISGGVTELYHIPKRIHIPSVWSNLPR